jgi:methionyl-tRNA formyltransferase
VSWFWTTRLPMTLVKQARLGGIGAHPSLLPRHRGPDPTYWAIASGDRETGVSVHRIEAEYDTGEVLAQERLAIDPRWTAWDLARALDRPSLRALRATVARFARGERVNGVAHRSSARHRRADSPTTRPQRSAGRGTPSACSAMRALAPSPGAWTEVAGQVVVVTRAEAAPRYPAALAPGEGVREGGLALVRTGDGAVTLLAGEIEGVSADAKELAALFLPPSPLVIG